MTSIFLLQCLKKLYKVDNYPISIIAEELIKSASQIIEKYKLIKYEENSGYSVDTLITK